MVSERFNCESLQRTMDAKLQQYLTWPLQASSELCTWFVSHNWMTLFRGWGNPPQKRGTSRCMTTLNEEYKGRVTYCPHLTSVVCELLDLIFSSESTWQIETKHDMILMFIEWFSKKTCVVSKEGVSILYMDFNYVSKGRHIVLFWLFLPLLLLLSEACPDHNLFFFPDRSIIFGM